MSFDHERIESLLNIVRECAGHTGKFAAISNRAMHELMDHNEDLRQKAMAATKERAVKDAEDQASAQAETEHKDGEVIHTADDPNPNLTDRRI
jgi:hypothetical protein